jgi:hypothetical protein
MAELMQEYERSEPYAELRAVQRPVNSREAGETQEEFEF